MNLSKQFSKNNLLAISIGIVYLWLGALKFFPSISPAEDLAKDTINSMTFGLIPSHVSIFLLAIWETGIGLLLISNVYRKMTVSLALVHIILTFAPLIIFPDLVFNNGPFNLTLLGQYITKNIIILFALISIFKETKEEGLPAAIKDFH